MIGIYDKIYNFISTWLFGGGSVNISSQGQEFACVLLSTIIIVWVLYLAILPIKAIITAIFRGW